MSKQVEFQSPEDKIIGKHVFGNLYDINPEDLNNEQLLKELVLNAVKIANMNLVEAKSWSFGGKKGRSLGHCTHRGEPYSTSYLE